MAEFCYECWNKINETHEPKWKYVLSWGKDLCEECGEYKRVIVAERSWVYGRKTPYRRFGIFGSFYED